MTRSLLSSRLDDHQKSLPEQQLRDPLDGRQTPYYQVEKIIDKKKVGDKTYYRVKWKNYSIRDATWQPLESLLHTMQIVAVYQKSIRKQRQQLDEQRKKKGTARRGRLKSRLSSYYINQPTELQSIYSEQQASSLTSQSSEELELKKYKKVQKQKTKEIIHENHQQQILEKAKNIQTKQQTPSSVIAGTSKDNVFYSDDQEQADINQKAVEVKRQHIEEKIIKQKAQQKIMEIQPQRKPVNKLPEIDQSYESESFTEEKKIKNQIYQPFPQLPYSGRKRGRKSRREIVKKEIEKQLGRRVDEKQLDDRILLQKQKQLREKQIGISGEKPKGPLVKSQSLHRRLIQQLKGSKINVPHIQFPADSDYPSILKKQAFRPNENPSKQQHFLQKSFDLNSNCSQNKHIISIQLIQESKSGNKEYLIEYQDNCLKKYSSQELAIKHPLEFVKYLEKRCT